MISSLLGRVIQFLVALLTVRLMTTLLSPSEVGNVALITSLVSFCVLFLISPFGTFVNRRLHSWHDSGRIKVYFVWYAQYLLAVATVSSLLVMMALHIGWIPLAVNAITLGMVVWGSILFGTVQQTLIPSLNLLGRDKAFAILSVLSPCLGLMLALLLTRFEGALLATRWLTGIVFSQLIFSIVAAGVFFKDEVSTAEPRPRLNRTMTRRAWTFAWPVSIAVTCSWFHFQSYRFVLADAVGLEALGFFVAGYGIAASLFAALEQILTTWFMPRFYRQVNQETLKMSSSAWVSYASSVLPLSILALAALYSLSDILVKWMLGPAFQDTHQYVRWGALAEWTRVVAGIYMLLPHQHMRTRDLVIPNILGALASVTVLILWGSTGSLYMIPVGMTVGNVLVIGVLRVTQGDGARLRLGDVFLLIHAAAISTLVIGFDTLLKRIGITCWTNQSIWRALTLLLIWGAGGMYMLRRVLVRVNTGEHS